MTRSRQFEIVSGKEITVSEQFQTKIRTIFPYNLVGNSRVRSSVNEYDIATFERKKCPSQYP